MYILTFMAMIDKLNKIDYITLNSQFSKSLLKFLCLVCFLAHIVTAFILRRIVAFLPET